MNKSMPTSIPSQYYDYVRLLLAAMAEKVSNVTEFVGIPTKGAGDEFNRCYPVDSDDDYDDEC